MMIQDMPIGLVKPYHQNPRVIGDDAVNAVAASLQEFGWRQPIVVDTDNVVIVGHTRLKAAQSLGYETVPVHVAEGLTDQQARAYRLADNKSGELAEWENGILLSEFDALMEGGFDIGALGFEPLAGPSFDPEVNPSSNQREVTGADVQRTEERMNQAGAQRSEQTLVEVICPHCAENFEVDPSSL